MVAPLAPHSRARRLSKQFYHLLEQREPFQSLAGFRARWKCQYSEGIAAKSRLYFVYIYLLSTLVECEKKMDLRVGFSDKLKLGAK